MNGLACMLAWQGDASPQLNYEPTMNRTLKSESYIGCLMGFRQVLDSPEWKGQDST